MNIIRLISEKLEEIERYFTLIQRPVRFKIEIINALASVAWDQDPYLPRAMALSDVYTDVYGEQYGSLVIFDEKEGNGRL